MAILGFRTWVRFAPSRPVDAIFRFPQFPLLAKILWNKGFFIFVACIPLGLSNFYLYSDAHHAADTCSLCAVFRQQMMEQASIVLDSGD